MLVFMSDILVFEKLRLALFIVRAGMAKTLKLLQTNLINPRNIATSCWCIMAHIPNTRMSNLSAKNCSNISTTYLVTEAMQILNHIHSVS